MPSSLYLCDSRFHVEALEELLETDAKWGFIIMYVQLPDVEGTWLTSQ